MMHFVRTLSIMRAQGVRLIAIERFEIMKELCTGTSKAFLKMAGRKMHTLHPTPWIRPWP